MRASRCICRTRRATTGGTGGSRTTNPDARDLADLLRLGRLAEAWIFRDRPELVRNATADAFPTSFDVLLAPQADWIAIKNQFERLAGVDQVIFTAPSDTAGFQQ